MTSIRDLVSESLAVGETFCLALEERDGDLVAPHPNAGSPMDLLVREGLELLPEQPPKGSVEVEVVGRVVDGRLVGRVVGLECDPTSVESNGGAEEADDEAGTG
ncbi:hypothetical protein [Natrononativus amylolyticus]|uniref:hypothetical protein n=1 Tax=Natrononativus amylolyticus TaxID=2963434 RepID=UPI0020CB92DF|nr:hypothetical protein [Natrononativus amylolyticus]